MITITEGVIIAIISSAVSISVTYYGLRRNIQDKYREKLYDKKIEAHSELSLAAAEIGFAVIKHKDEWKKLELSEFRKMGENIGKISMKHSFFHTDSVITAKREFITACAIIEDKLEKNEEVTQSDSDNVGKAFQKLNNVMRADLKLGFFHDLKF